MSEPAASRPNTWPLPPLVTVGIMASCLVLDRFLPLGWEPEDVSTFMRGTGWALVVLAILIDVWAMLTFRRHRANIMPHRAATDLITDGPFAHSRNPIYLANVMLTVGFAFALGSRWFLFGAALLFVLLQEYAIKREERHMEALFGVQWRDYAKAVRRWA